MKFFEHPGSSAVVGGMTDVEYDAKLVCKTLSQVACSAGMDEVITGLRWFLEETTTEGILKVRAMAAAARSRDLEEWPKQVTCSACGHEVTDTPGEPCPYCGEYMP